jgi:phenylpropionate dioxygenase-like ring-hydroxylating dioxygenase large terminal subunit
MGDALEPSALDQWHCIGPIDAVPQGESGNRLLGRDLAVMRDGDAIEAHAEGEIVALCRRYGYLWATFGAPAKDVVDIPEADEPDRRITLCGTVAVRASGLRIVENFLDMAHFPFVHTDILGSEPHTEVQHYDTEIRRDVDEVWATNCVFRQPKAALSAAGAIETRYMYRVASPFVTILYKTCPNAENRWDVICLFVQPLDADRCRAHPVMFLIDDVSTQTDLVHFQQVIFLQDRIILENQRPRLLPLQPRAEIPTRADASSIAYRRWLKEKGHRYGATVAA